jgi:hypothetical protein
VRTTIAQLVREQDRIHQRRMWRRMRRGDRLRAWAPIMLGASTLVALSIAGTMALVQAAAQL